MRTLATAALCAAVAACLDRTNGASDDTEWTMEGMIAGVEPGPEATRLTVEVASEGVGTEPGPVVLLVSPETDVRVEREDGTSERGGAADLAVGARILARHTEEQLRSLPPQYRATHIRVLPGP